MTDTLHARTRVHGVQHIEIDRPQVRNALGQREYVRLAELIETAGAQGCPAVVLTSRGPTFCAGNELAEFESAWPQPAHGPVYRFLAALAACPCPVVAGVQGGAVGIGATLLLHCDAVLMHKDAFLAYPFVKLGISVEGGSSWLLPARIGYLRAMELLLESRKVPADEAVRLGLATSVVDADVAAHAVAAAERIGALDAAAVRATKRQLRREAASFPQRFEEEIQAINALIVARRAGASQ